MIGGLMKSTSSLALTIAAGLVLSTNAFAADLGGNCCADLEERVAELEATTARKGNRKVSLTISGQVNRSLMYWNDGGRSNTYFGLDNTNSSTRIGFSGNATINSEWKAGFSIVMDISDKARTVSAAQLNEEGGSKDLDSRNADHGLRVRDANWWIESSRLGRLTVGRLTTSGATGVIDLGGINVIAASQEGCIGTSLAFRQSNGALLSTSLATIGAFSTGCAHPTTRQEGMKYSSPTLHGFSFSATIAEAIKTERNTIDASPTNIGTVWGADLRYANEFNGLRVAGSLGYERSNANEGDAGANFGVTPSDTPRAVHSNADFALWGIAGSLFHVPTGLFVQGTYQWASSKSPIALAGLPPVATDTGNLGAEARANNWHIQGGISRNFFGVGNTNLYGEFGQFNDWARMNTLNNTAAVATGQLNGISGDSMRFWGIGAVQNIDSAAMELYIGYRNFSASLKDSSVSLQDIDVVAAGARIKF